MLEVIELIGSSRVGRLDVPNGIEVDTMLRKKRLVFLEPVYEFSFAGLLLPPTRRQRRHDSTLDSSLDAISARLVFITTNLPLLAQNTGMPSSQFHNRRVGYNMAGKPLISGKGRHCALPRPLSTYYNLYLSMEAPVSNSSLSDPKRAGRLAPAG